MEDLQARLRALGDRRSYQWPLRHRFRDLLSDETVEMIKELTNEPVYIVLRYRFNSEPYHGGFSLMNAFISLEAGVLEEYPYLNKYPHWQELFDPIEGTNCHLLGITETDWLNKKSRHYEFKQRMQ